MRETETGGATGVRRGSFIEIFGVFLWLGLTCFGGPIAHLGYFRDEFVSRRRWLGEEAYADLVALSQFLPGPASSKVGFSIGLMRGGGLTGGLAAWLGFTMPSAVALVAFALLAGSLPAGFVHGLKLVAVVVVAQAVWGMAGSLTPDRQRATIAVVAVGLIALVGPSWGQIGAILLGAAAGLAILPSSPAPAGPVPGLPVSRRAGAVSLLLFGLLLVLLPLVATQGQGLALFDAFYRSGALVFGGGHVLLPLLQSEVVASGWVPLESFLAGYGLTQAVPGPLFTFAAYLGAVAGPEPNGIAGAAIALVAVFLPGLLLAYGILPFWQVLRGQGWARSAMRGANAAVVGILAAALYDPVWTSAVVGPADFALALGGFLLLQGWKLPPWTVVCLLALAGALVSFLSVR
jgi:chromate transporter